MSPVKGDSGALVFSHDGAAEMRWITEYLRCEQVCRDLAGKLTKPDDKLALELMALGWAARAAERKRAIACRSPQQATHTAGAPRRASPERYVTA